MILMNKKPWLLSLLILAVGMEASYGGDSYSYQPVDLSAFDNYQSANRGTNTMNPGMNYGMPPSNGMNYGMSPSNGMQLNGMNNFNQNGFNPNSNGFNGPNGQFSSSGSFNGMSGMSGGSGKSHKIRRLKSPLFDLDNVTVAKIRTSLNMCKHNRMLRYHSLFKRPNILLLFLRDLDEMMQRPKIGCGHGHFHLTVFDRLTLLKDPYFRRSLMNYVKNHPQVIMQLKNHGSGGMGFGMSNGFNSGRMNNYNNGYNNNGNNGYNNRYNNNGNNGFNYNGNNGYNNNGFNSGYNLNSNFNVNLNDHFGSDSD